MLKVLKQIQEKTFQLDIDKYEFSITEMKYLELIVTTKDLYIDLEKV